MHITYMQYDIIHYLDAMFTVEVSSTNAGIEIELESL